MKLIDQIRQAGVVGCGGAGFPTHVKLNAKPEIFIVNGAECEPLLRTDRYLMIHESERLVAGVELICEALGITNGCIALKKTYKEEIAALRETIARRHSYVRLHLMDSFYPAGDEQVVVYEVTGKVVPPAGIPLDVGAVVDNVATVIAVYDAARGIPFTDKYVTVTGEVREPVVVKVPVGTSVRRCIELAGGPARRDVMVVMGGPMMGVPMSWDQAMEACIKKTTNGLLILPEGCAIDRRRQTQLVHILNRAKSACIQCSYCTQMCPRHMLGHPLQPHRIMRRMAACADIKEVLDDPQIRNAAICSECGICEVYACPMGLQPRVVNGYLKGELAAAGIRYQKTGETYAADANRELRKAPTARVAARAGVGDYYGISGHGYKEDVPERVTLPLRMHIGAPCQPIVSEGDRVEKGQLVAVCPEGKLGADLHASIAGRVHLTNDSIMIEV